MELSPQCWTGWVRKLPGCMAIPEERRSPISCALCRDFPLCRNSAHCKPRTAVHTGRSLRISAKTRAILRASTRYVTAAQSISNSGKTSAQSAGGAERNPTSGEVRPHEADVLGMALDERLPLRHRTFDLNPAAVADIVHRLADGREIYASLSQQEAVLLRM